MTFGSRLKYLRTKNKELQQDIADLISVKVRQVQRYEKDESDIPLSKAIIIADYYNVSLDYLSGRLEGPHESTGPHKGKPSDELGHLSDKEKELIRLFNDLSDERKDSLTKGVQILMSGLKD